MTSQHLRAAYLVAAALVLIAGCRNTDRADAATPSMAPPALIARGQVDTERGTLSIGLPIDGTIADVAGVPYFVTWREVLENLLIKFPMSI